MTVATFATINSATTTELLLFLVSNLSATTKAVTAQSISHSNILESDEELSAFWDMLHFTTQDEIAADVSAILTGISDDLSFLF